MTYLVNKYAKNDSLYPKDPKQKALIDQMMYFDAGSLYFNVIKCYVCIHLSIAISLTNILMNIFFTFHNHWLSYICIYLYISTNHKS